MTKDKDAQPEPTFRRALPLGRIALAVVGLTYAFLVGARGVAGLESLAHVAGRIVLLPAAALLAIFVLVAPRRARAQNSYEGIWALVALILAVGLELFAWFSGLWCGDPLRGRGSVC